MENGMQLPEDPYLLLSFVNLKLRDYYTSPAAMCDDLELSLSDINLVLKQAGYEYNKNSNQYYAI